jgi:hypothetical protein
MRLRITHRKKQKYTRKRNDDDPMEGGRDARSVSEGETRRGASSDPRRDSGGDERQRPEWRRSEQSERNRNAG